MTDTDGTDDAVQIEAALAANPHVVLNGQSRLILGRSICTIVTR